MSGLANRISAALGSADLGDLAHQMTEIKARAGSGRAAARAVGIGDGTWRRWWAAAGLGGGGAGGRPARPSAGNAAKLAAAVVDGRVKDRADRVGDMTIKATQRARSPRENGRERTLNATNLRLAAGTGEAVATAYYSAGPEAAAVAFLRGIGETEFYRPMLAASVIKDWESEDYDPEADWWEDVYDYADFEDGDGYGLDV